MLSVILWSTSYDYPFVFCVVRHSVNYVIWLPFCPLCCLSFCELRHMITLCVVCHSVNYVIWIPFCPLCCLSFCEVSNMITLFSFVLSVILWITSYDYPFVLCVVCHSVNYVIWLPFCPLCCLSFCEVRHMITLLVSSYFSCNMFDEDFFFKHIFIQYSNKYQHSLFLIYHSNKQALYKKSSKIQKG